MATEQRSGIEEMSATTIESTMSSIKKMIVLGAAFVVLGYVLLLIAGIEDLFTIWAWADSTKMWFKLGGVGHILVGIFISLVAIIRTLSLVPDRLSARL